MFSAVINLCYSLADGIIYTYFNQAFWGFDNKKKKSRFESLRDEHNILGILKSIDKRLGYRGEINRDTIQDIREGDIDIMSNNRHLVLHGHSYLYGTKKNAVKAILLLDFINELVFLKNWKQL